MGASVLNDDTLCKGISALIVILVILQGYVYGDCNFQSLSCCTVSNFSSNLSHNGIARQIAEGLLHGVEC